MRIVERPIGTSTAFIEVPYSIIDTKEKTKNVLASHVGWYIVNTLRTVDPTSFQPKLGLTLINPSAADQSPTLLTTTVPEYYLFNVEFVVDQDIAAEFAIEPVDQLQLISVIKRKEQQ
jgi:hypothetical protein